MLLHLQSNVDPWASPTLDALDHALTDAGSHPVSLPWAAFELAEDGSHFTERGAIAFSNALVANVAPLLPTENELCIVSDSTIDHNDRDDNGFWHGRASRRIVRTFAQQGVRARVDAVGGSGFVARAREGDHFRARLSRWPRGEPCGDSVLLVGGWNDDDGRPSHRVCSAAVACANLVVRRHNM